MQYRPDFSFMDLLVKVSVYRDRLVIWLPFLLQISKNRFKKCAFPCTVFEQLGVLLFGDYWDAMFLNDCGVSKQMIDNGAFNNESDFLTHLLIHKIPLKFAEGPMAVIKIFEQEIKFFSCFCAYVAKLLHKKLKIEAHFLKILF